MVKKKRLRIFIEGDVLVHKHFSGIGHYTAELLSAIDKLLLEDEYSHVKVSIGVHWRDMHKLTKFNFENFSIRRLAISGHVANGLKGRHRIPPIDLFYGRQVYLFPNYSSWPTLFSPSVPFIYDLSFIHHGHLVEPRNQKFLVDQVNLSVKRAKRIVTISKNSQSEILEEYKGVPENKVDIIYPAVDFHKFYPRSKHEIEYIKAKYGIFGNYILFVGNIEPRKNLITLLHAYDKLPANIQSKYGVLLVGARGWLDDEIHNTIIDMRMRGLQVIQPNDYVVDDDLPALYSGASAFAYISKYEGFGIPPVESMACGTPVISSDNSSLPEAVGEAAIKIDANADQAVADALVEILTKSELSEKLVSAGYEQAKKFDWEKSARQLLDILAKVAK